ncbi:MAG TPA: hypothetical protein VJB87_00240 [Candidatus Nanoarchaeia archaeon]|nr:hypothetical protein [Candidatus Nanoarchaeia archaeon]
MPIRKIFHASDVHEDVDAFRGFTNFASAQGADALVVSGDWSLLPCRRDDYRSLLAQRSFVQERPQLITSLDRGMVSLLAKHGPGRGLDAVAAAVQQEGVAQAYKVVFPEVAQRRLRRAHQEYMVPLLRQMYDMVCEPGIPVVGVGGNYDPLMADILGESDVHARKRDVAGFRWRGYSGGNANPGYVGVLEDFGITSHFDESELEDVMIRAYIDDKREQPAAPVLWVIHNPPLFVTDALGMEGGGHGGSPLLLQQLLRPSLVPRKGKRVLFCGHIHEAGPHGNAAIFQDRQLYESVVPSQYGAGSFRCMPGVGAVQTSRGEVIPVINSGNLGRFDIKNFPSPAELADRRWSPDRSLLQTVHAFDFGTFSRVDMRDDGSIEQVVQYSLMDKSALGGRSVGKVRELRTVPGKFFTF